MLQEPIAGVNRLAQTEPSGDLHLADPASTSYAQWPAALGARSVFDLPEVAGDEEVATMRRRRPGRSAAGA